MILCGIIHDLAIKKLNLSSLNIIISITIKLGGYRTPLALYFISSDKRKRRFKISIDFSMTKMGLAQLKEVCLGINHSSMQPYLTCILE
ncbi:hypothetical protein GFK82_00393 [Candidatus Steffania adelgidicola]|nr:hypothetical protein GFK82_00393 [Candidatus Steffania adelgidicola]